MHFSLYSTNGFLIAWLVFWLVLQFQLNFIATNPVTIVYSKKQTKLVLFYHFLGTRKRLAT